MTRRPNAQKNAITDNVLQGFCVGLKVIRMTLDFELVADTLGCNLKDNSYVCASRAMVIGDTS